MDFAILVGWKAMIKAIFPKAIDGHHLKLVHFSSNIHIPPSVVPSKKYDLVETPAQNHVVLNQALGKMVEVCETISRYHWPIMC